MSERKCIVADDQNITNIIAGDYHKDLFCAIEPKVRLELDGFDCGRCGHAAYLKLRDEEQVDTTFYLPLGMWLSDGKHYTSPLAGIQAPALKQDLWLPMEADGDMRFLFGKCIIENPQFNLSLCTRGRRITFYVIDDPNDAELIDSIMTVRKLSASGGEETESGWLINYLHGDSQAYYFQRTTATYDGYCWEFRVYPLRFRFVYPNRNGKFRWEENARYYNTFAELVTAHREDARELCVQLLCERDETKRAIAWILVTP